MEEDTDGAGRWAYRESDCAYCGEPLDGEQVRGRPRETCSTACRLALRRYLATGHVTITKDYRERMEGFIAKRLGPPECDPGRTATA